MKAGIDEVAQAPVLVSVDVEDVATHLLEQRSLAHLEHLGDLHAREGGRARAQEERAASRSSTKKPIGEVASQERSASSAITVVEALALQLGAEEVELGQLHVGDERHDVRKP